jgi:hypothetical protein
MLHVAVGAKECALCICDVDDTGAVTASDALAVLTAAIGLPTTLTCPASPAPAGTSTTSTTLG